MSDDGERLSATRPQTDEQRDRERERAMALFVSLPAPLSNEIAFDASQPGVHLIDVIEGTLHVEEPDKAWVRLPRGHATVEFLRMLYAVSG